MDPDAHHAGPVPHLDLAGVGASARACGPPIDHTIALWDGAGTSGVLALQVGLEVAESVVLCAIPLDTSGHFFDPVLTFGQGISTAQAWATQLPRMLGRVTSMSGWTRATFGEPEQCVEGRWESPFAWKAREAGPAAAREALIVVAD